MSGRVGSITTDIVTDELVFNADSANRASTVPSANTTTVFNTIDTSIQGTFTNDAQFAMSGSIPTWDFDGTDDSINCGDNNIFSSGNGSSDSPFSISAWIKFDTVGATAVIAQKYSSYPNGEYRLYKSGATGKIVFRIISGNQELNRRGRATNDIDSLVGQWLHVVSTYNGNSNYSGIKIYINGVQSDTANDGKNSYVAMNNTSYNFQIGPSFPGHIANIQIYHKELSSSEILHNYNALKGRFDL